MNLKTSTYNADTHVLVPKEPTPEMKMAGAHAAQGLGPLPDLLALGYAAMLAAAPSLPEPAQEGLTAEDEKHV